MENPPCVHAGSKSVEVMVVHTPNFIVGGGGSGEGDVDGHVGKEDGVVGKEEGVIVLNDGGRKVRWGKETS